MGLSSATKYRAERQIDHSALWVAEKESKNRANRTACVSAYHEAIRQSFGAKI